MRSCRECFEDGGREVFEKFSGAQLKAGVSAVVAEEDLCVVRALRGAHQSCVAEWTVFVCVGREGGGDLRDRDEEYCQCR